MCIVLLAQHAVADMKCPGLSMCLCNNNMTIVNCTHQQLSEIPKDIPVNVERLILSNNAIHNVSRHSFEGLHRLREIWLNDNNISCIDSFAFQNQTQLRSLYLYNNLIRYVGPYAFSDVPNLHLLDLSNNSLDDIGDNVFHGCSSLCVLILNRNNFSSVNVPALCQIKALQRLEMNYNAINNATFPDCFTALKNLTSISLAVNQIRHLSKSCFAAMSGVQMSLLDLSYTNLKYVDEEVFNNVLAISSLNLSFNSLLPLTLKNITKSLIGKNITTLNLSNSTFKHMYDDLFFALVNLQRLDLSLNELRRFPQRLPKRLRVLNLYKNKIKLIPNGVLRNITRLEVLVLSNNNLCFTYKQAQPFYGLNKLVTLQLQYNHIHWLPSILFEKLVQLKYLNLRSNKLRRVDLNGNPFKELISLRKLDLSNNRISSISPQTLINLTSLKSLKLSHNKLGTALRMVGVTLFDNLQNLTNLELTHNNISVVPVRSFRSLVHLDIVKISNNVIVQLGKNSFTFAPNLRKLDVSNNKISYIDQETLRSITKSLESLNLMGNRFECNCALMPFIHWMKHSSVLVVDANLYTCSGPKHLERTLVASFDISIAICFLLDIWHILVIITITIGFIIAVAGVMYRNRWTIKLYVYKLKRRSRLNREHGHEELRDDEERERPFDAYISSSPHDSTWIVKHLLPGIDNGELGDEDQLNGEFSLYYDQRDALPGLF